MRNLLGIALFAASTVFAADPYVGYIYPAGIQAGTTNRLVVGGQGFQGVQSVHLSGRGVRVLSTQLVPGFPNPNRFQKWHLTRWLNGIAEGRLEEPPIPPNSHEEEWRKNAWWSKLGTLDRQQLAIVERDLFTPRNALQASPSLRQLMLVTVVADIDAKPGRRSLVVETGKGMSAPRPLLVSVVPRIAEPLYVPPHRDQPSRPRVDVREGASILEGQIMPGETDFFTLKLAGGRPYVLNVTARELQPYIGDAVPGFFNPVVLLKNSQGEIVASADDHQRFRPDPIMCFTPPADGEYRFEIHDVLYRGRADFVYSVRIGGAGRGDKFRNARSTCDGVVSAGQSATKKFTVERPGRRVLEVTARRRGSPLDAVLTLRKAGGGPVLAQWDDVTNRVFVGTIPQGECDPIGLYDFKEPGEYVAEITDRTGHGGPDYFWWLDVRRPRPGFAVYSTRSTLPVVRGKPLPVGFRVVRKDGFTGDIAIGGPTFLKFSNHVVTSGVDQVTASLEYVGRGRMPTTRCDLFATATINGKKVEVPVIPCDEYEQAFAWKHLVPAETFLVRGQGGWKPPRPAGGKPAPKRQKKK